LVAPGIIISSHEIFATRFLTPESMIVSRIPDI